MMELPFSVDSRWDGTADTCGAEVPPSLPSYWPNRFASAQVRAGEMNWHVQRMGSGPRLLLVHGTAASTHTWRTLMPLLAKDFEVLAVDLPGHGYSDRRADGSMSLLAISEALHTLLSHLEFKPGFVVGHSAGAAIVLRMALDHTITPDAIVGLNAALLPFGGPLSAVFAPMAKVFASTGLVARVVSRRARDAAAVRRVLHGTGSDIDADGVRYYQHLLQREQHVAAVLSMMANWRLGGLLDDLPSLSADLHLVCGLNDRAVSPREADSVVRLLETTQVSRLENCGHLAHEEAPETVADIVRSACRIGVRVDHA